MANELRRQVREAAATALTSLATTGARVYQSRVYDMQATDLPGLRVYTNSQTVEQEDIGANPGEVNRLELVVEGCAKAAADLDDTLDAMVKEVRVAIAANQALAGAKYVALRGVEIEMEGEADAPRGVARMTFEVLYYSAQNAPDMAI